VPFDPNKPFEVEGAGGGFDPSKPFTADAPAAPTKGTPRLKGSGSMASPFDLSGGESRAALPKGAIYRDPQGNLRRNDNGDAGNPILPPPRKPSVAGDVARSGLTGAVQGVDGYLGAYGDLRNGLNRMDGLGIVKGWRRGMESLSSAPRQSAERLRGSGLPGFSQIGDAALGAMDMVDAFNPMMLGGTAAPDSAQVTAARQATVGPDYIPRTTPGKYARSVGRMLPNAVIPGGAAKKAAAVVLPAMGGEAARGTAETMGAGPGGQVVAEMAGQLVGGSFAGLRPGAVRDAVRLPAPRRVMDYTNADAVAAELETAKTAAYKAASEYGAVYTPEATSQLMADIAAIAARDRLHPLATPKAAAVVEKLQAEAGKPMTLDDIDSLRQYVGRTLLGKAADDEQHFGVLFRREIDKFLDGVDPGLMSSGSPEIAATLIGRARQANQKWRKVEDLATQVGRKSDLASISGTGGNQDNAMRQGVYKSMERQYGLTPGEEAAYRGASIPTKTHNVLRGLGRLSPETGGLQNWFTASSLTGGGALSLATHNPALAILGAAPVLAGFVAKRIADGDTRKLVTRLVETLATGAPEAQAAQRELQSLAGSNPEVAQVYNEIMTHLTRGGGLGTALGSSAYLAPAAGMEGQ